MKSRLFAPCLFALLLLQTCLTVGAVESAKQTEAPGKEANRLVNPSLSDLDDKGPRGWQCGGEFRYDPASQVASLSFVARGSLTQNVSLPPGHYVLRAVARANSIEAILMADSLDYDLSESYYKTYGDFCMPIGVSRDFKQCELPFVVEEGNPHPAPVRVGFRQYYTVQHRVVIEIKEVAVVRLGDTTRRWRWAQNWPSHPWHQLEALREAPPHARPGRVIFTDTGTQAEVWLMTQGGRSRLQYVGIDVFDPRGKYLYVLGLGSVLRTDTSIGACA